MLKVSSTATDAFAKLRALAAIARLALGLKQVARLSADAGDEVRAMANAYNALILSSEEERNVLERAASASGADATPLEIANAILRQSEALSIAAHGAQ